MTKQRTNTAILGALARDANSILHDEAAESEHFRSFYNIDGRMDVKVYSLSESGAVAFRKEMLLSVLDDINSSMPAWFSGEMSYIKPELSGSVLDSLSLEEISNQINSAVIFFRDNEWMCPLKSKPAASLAQLVVDSEEEDVDSEEDDAELSCHENYAASVFKWQCECHGLVLQGQLDAGKLGPVSYSSEALSASAIEKLNADQSVFLSTLRKLANELPIFFFSRRNEDARPLLTESTLHLVGETMKKHPEILDGVLKSHEELDKEDEETNCNSDDAISAFMSRQLSIGMIKDLGYGQDVSGTETPLNQANCTCDTASLMRQGCTCNKG